MQINSKEKTEISHWHKCPDPQVPLISLDHLWDASTPRLQSTGGESNWLDMIWKRHTPLYTKVSQELPAKLRDRIVSRLKTCLLHWRFPRAEEWLPRFLNWRSLEQLGTWQKLSNRGRRAFSKTMFTLAFKMRLGRLDNKWTTLNTSPNDHKTNCDPITQNSCRGGLGRNWPHIHRIYIYI